VTVACTASLADGTAPIAVTAFAAGPPPTGTDFPYGPTAVTCLATDGAGLKSKPVAFTILVNCPSGYSWRDGACKSERRERGRRAGRAARWWRQDGRAARPATGASWDAQRANPSKPPSPRPLPPPDNDECVLGGGATCSPNAQCTDDQGSYSCACKAGFEGDGGSCTSERGRAAPHAFSLPFRRVFRGRRGRKEGSPPLSPLPGGSCPQPPRPVAPRPPPDIDECTAGTHNCHPNATCADVPGTFTCTCRANLGFSGDGVTCTDSEKPTLTADAALVSAAAAPAETAAALAFPTLTATDNVTPPEAIVIECKAALTKGAEPVPVKGAGDAAATKFPVGTTVVTCTATDEAKLVSTPVTFAVVVTCSDGYALKGGACTGKHTQAGAATHTRHVDFGC
jgi:hypothetical protein